MYRGIYYWTYWYVKKIKTNKRPEEGAYFMMSTFLTFNIVTLYMVINLFIDLNSSLRTIPSVIPAIVLFVPIMIFNKIYLLDKKEIIFKHFDEQEKTERMKNIVGYWIYVLITTVSFFLLGSIINK